MRPVGPTLLVWADNWYQSWVRNLLCPCTLGWCRPEAQWTRGCEARVCSCVEPDRGMILAISLSGVSPWRCPILAQSGRRDHPVRHSGVSFGLVRRSLGFLSGGLSYIALSPDGAPGERCLTEAWPGSSGHDRWRNGVVHRGDHHYGEGRQRL